MPHTYTDTEFMQHQGDRVLQAIRLFWATRGFSPSYRDIVETCHLNSTAHARKIVQHLADTGRIQYEPGIARSIRVTQ